MNDLHKCRTNKDSQLYYIINTKTFTSCSSNTLNNIDLTGEQEPAGQDGIKSSFGADCISFVWMGSSKTLPPDPELNWENHNLNNGNTYIYDSSAWYIMIDVDNDDDTYYIPGNSSVSIGYAISAEPVHTVTSIQSF